MVLPAHEREACAQLKEKSSDISDHLVLESLLLDTLICSYEVEDVGIFERLLHHFTVRRRKYAVEIGNFLGF